MKKRIILSTLMMFVAIVASSTSVAAFFTASAAIRNNTFSTGTLDIRLFYDCIGEEEAIFGLFPDFTVVECPENGDGSLERAALKYEVSDGATYDSVATGDIYNLESGDNWATTNGWWGGLSSAIDHTLIYPGWTASNPPFEDSDLLSVGNSGDLPLELSMTLEFEAYQAFFEFEPFDGEDPGGDRVDPHTDFGWVNFLDREYDTDLAEAIELTWERVDNDGAVVDGHTGSATLASIIAGGALDLGELDPDEVAYIRFNWEMPEESGDEYQNLVFDYSINFDAIQVGATP